MRISIIIPAHNEEAYLKYCLDSFVGQTRTPNSLVVVDDNSSDGTFFTASEYAREHSWIQVVPHRSSDKHIPGGKVVDTFNFGLRYASAHDLVGKFDADIVLPPDYFETVLDHFQGNRKLGMCGGLLYIKKDNGWIYEPVADKYHVRGPIKLYHKACFNAIGGLRPGVGWDTVDVLLAKYHGFDIHVDSSLKVRHLRPTGRAYSSKNAYAKGEALYKMRYGTILAKISALKMALQKRSVKLYLQILWGYFRAVGNGHPRFVNSQEGAFIRKTRWKGIRNKLFQYSSNRLSRSPVWKRNA